MALTSTMVLPSSISVCCIDNNHKQSIACHHPSLISVKPKPRYFCKSTSPSFNGRRKVLQSTILSALLILQPVLSPNWVAAEEENGRKNDLIERLLEKSKANRDKYAKERLDDYYKRNYMDYFDFVEGSVKQGELTEAEKGIMEWLKKNR